MGIYVFACWMLLDAFPCLFQFPAPANSPLYVCTKPIVRSFWLGLDSGPIRSGSKLFALCVIHM